MSARRTKWHPPPPPAPRILHFPRRSLIFRPAKHRAKSPAALKPNLEVLMRQESRRFMEEERRPKVEEPSSSASGEITRDSAEERWRFQAEVLRAECNFLRMEREVALRKLERNRVQMESASSYFMETMISGRKKIDGNASMALTEGIEETLEKIHGGFKWRKEKVGRSGANFDRRRLETTEEETSVKKTRQVSDQITEPAFSSKEDNVSLPSSNRKCTFDLHSRSFLTVFVWLSFIGIWKVEKLRMKMEGLSKGMLETMAEHGLLSLPFDSTTAAADRGSERRRLFGKEVGAAAGRSFSLLRTEETKGARSCCNCKNLADKIAEQAMAEAEQCGEMQAMLDKVKTEMEELRSSRDRWERRAIASELKFRALHSQMSEWKRRPLELREMGADLRQAEAEALQASTDQLDSEICRLKQLKIREKQKKSTAVREKQVVARQRRPPLREIGNLPPKKDSAARMFR